jgi:hypothetical protein
VFVGRARSSRVSVIKSLWASVQGDPVFMRRVNGWLTIFWIVMIPVSITLGLLSSVVYVSALSLWALVSGHWSAWQAARVEVAQSAETQKLEENPIEERVVEQLIQETDIASVETKCAPSREAPAATPPDPSLRRRVDDLVAQLAELQRHVNDDHPTTR